MTFAARMGRVAPSATLKVTAEADRLRRQGVDVVDLGAGEPDFPTPPHVTAAAHAALDANFTKYTPAAGVMELREAVAQRYALDYGVSVAPEQVIATAGGKQALFNAALALFGPGDEVITHGPFWPSIPEQIKLAGADPVIVPTSAADGFTIHAAPLLAAITPRTRGIIVNSPCNPTGALVTEAAMAEVAAACAARGIWLIADLTYEKLLYDEVPHNVPAVMLQHAPEQSIIVGATSKAYAMTGWRCGWSIAPKAATAQFNVIQGHSTSNVSSITQKAAIAALTGPQDAVAAMLAEYRVRRDRAYEWLTADPRFTVVKPRGAFYLFPRCVDALAPAGVTSSAAFAEELLREAHVAVTPGEGFDLPGYFRLSYATSLDRLREGIDRIHAFVRAREIRSV